MMKCLILLLLGFPTFLFHCLLPMTVLISIIIYKLYTSSDQKQRVHLARKQIGIIMKEKLVKMTRRSNPAKRSSHMALVVLLMLSITVVIEQVYSLEQDAKIIEPFAGLAKSIIRTATEGKPLEIDISATDLVKSLGSFAWKSRGFPVAALRNFMAKAQDFYNDTKARVDQTEVANIERKTLSRLKVDLDAIVDSIVQEVRQSRDGIFTDYLETNVNGQSLGDACTAVGVQLKAYGIDLTNYRNIAGAVLGVPIVPQIASGVVNTAKLAPNVANRVTGGVTSGVSTLTSAGSASLSGVRDMAARFIPH